MSGTFKPVILDDTAKMLVEAVRASNAGQREMRDLLAAQNEVLKGIQVGDMPIMLIPVSYNGSEYSLAEGTSADIKAAIADGLTPVLQITHEGYAYLIPCSRMNANSNGVVVGVQFDTDEHCPDGTFGMFSIMLSSGKITKSQTAEMPDSCKNIVIRVGNSSAAVRERLRLAKASVGALMFGGQT